MLGNRNIVTLLQLSIKSSAASSTARFARKVKATVCCVLPILTSALALSCTSTFAQSTSVDAVVLAAIDQLTPSSEGSVPLSSVEVAPKVATEIAPTSVLPNDLSTVPTQMPDQFLSSPLGSPVEMIQGGQSVKVRDGLGCGVVTVRAQDEVWLVSARQPNQGELTLERLIDGRWATASMAELTEAHATDQQKSTLVYVHGNRTNDVYSRSRGLQFYENIFNREELASPVRFVIFAWRSEREKIRPSTDYRVKLQRAVDMGPTLANFLNQFNDRRMVLTGFSLGGQVVLSGLNQLQCQAGNLEEVKTGKYQVALVTPALKAGDCENSVASLPSNPFAAKTVVFVNQKDNAIRVAKLVAKVSSRQPSVTLEQVASQPACEMLNTIVIEDITNQVNSCHSITKYSAQSSRLRSVVHEMVPMFQGADELTMPQCDGCQLEWFTE